MDNQHRKIKGYSELTQAQIDLMNTIKAKGQELELLCCQVASHIADRDPQAEPQFEHDAFAFFRGGRNDLQVGLMKLTRAVARPSFF